MVDLRWFDAARRAATPARRGELQLVFPTIKHLEQLAGVRHRPPRCSPGRPAARSCAVEPRVVGGEVARVVLPGEPGYDG